jgi:glyoxylase-like metal-dependent hydrolase (beta-lactamase superfamily II)
MKPTVRAFFDPATWTVSYVAYAAPGGACAVIDPGGDARLLYRSVRRLLSLPAETRLFMCHDYPPPGRGPQWESSVAQQRAANIHIRDAVSEDEFVAMRTARDRTLEMPTLILPSIQVNIRAGELPPAEANGVSYLKIPLNAL